MNVKSHLITHISLGSCIKSIDRARSSMVIRLVCHEMSLSSVWSARWRPRSMSLLYAEIVHGAREVKFGSGSRWSAERVSGLETR